LGADIISLGLFMHARRRLWMLSGAGPGVTAQQLGGKANLGTNQVSTSGSINYSSSSSNGQQTSTHLRLRCLDSFVFLIYPTATF
jgi:hypothetical protein